jgi:hypothetical protein
LNRWKFGDVLALEYVNIDGSYFIRRLIVDVDALTMKLRPRFWYQWITEEEYKRHNILLGQLGEDDNERVPELTLKTVES